MQNKGWNKILIFFGLDLTGFKNLLGLYIENQRSYRFNP